MKRNVIIVLALAWTLQGCTIAVIGAVNQAMKSNQPPVAADQRLADLGHSALSGGSYGLAEAYLTEALAANPDNPDALHDLGVVYSYTRRTGKAREVYAKLAALDLPAGGLDRADAAPRPSPTEVVRR